MSVINRNFRTLVRVFFGVCFVAATVNAGESMPTSITIDVERETVAVVDPFEVAITVNTPNGVTVAFPAPSNKVGSFDVLGVRDNLDIPTATGRQWIRRYRLESVTTGDVEIPAMEMSFVDRRGDEPKAGSVKSEARKIKVTSSLAPDESVANFRDIKGAVMLGETQTWLNGWRLAGLSTAGALLAFAFFLYRKLKKPLTPRQWALRALDDLEKSEETKIGNYEWIYESASNVLRDFVHSRLDVSAPWLTTPEFFKHLKSSDRMTDDMRTRLAKFMKSADLVKFAAMCCDEEVLKTALNYAREFVIQCDDEAPTNCEEKKSTSTEKVLPRANGTPRGHLKAASNGRF